jgi:signal transduction histidine kinase
MVAAQALGDARRERVQSRREVAASRQEQALMEERARIARELHDVVAHHISMVAVQAETARLTTPGMPEQGQERLLAIGDTAREALTEMRRLLGVLRADADGDAELAPQPGLGHLTELLEGARAAGTSVRLTVGGTVAPLPAGVDLTAYRIVQEALTNARRHAPGAAVEVELRFEADALHLRVRDDGPGPGEGEPRGHGLLGMRERAASVGGTLRSGRAEAGGFEVEAELPL